MSCQHEKEIADLKAQLATALADRRNMIYVNSLLRDRPDLGNRAKTVDALIKENTELQRKVDNLYESALAITKVGARAIAETTDLQEENADLRELLDKAVELGSRKHIYSAATLDSMVEILRAPNAAQEDDTLKDWHRKMVSSDANRIEFP